MKDEMEKYFSFIKFPEIRAGKVPERSEMLRIWMWVSNVSVCASIMYADKSRE